uniref:Uncharacterized protein n=1 Tax=Gadus morhua TaxID=8049 RepID=A0A8C4Z8F5_GADMO
MELEIYNCSIHKPCCLCLGMASAITSWSEEDFSCSICLEVFTSPVTIPCGHNFCRTCITKFWEEQVKYKCPVCNKIFDTRQDPQVNTLLSELAAQFRMSVRVKEQPFVESAEVPCDVCTGTQLKAVKSCLVCLISYCQTHLEPHQRVAGLKKHRLVEPMDLLQRIQERKLKIKEIKKLKSTAKQAEDLIIELEQEMEDLTNRSSEVKQLSHTEDHLHFLQTFRSLKNPPSTRDWTAVELHEDAELTRVQQYEVDVTLDPDTAHPNLILSEDGKQVHDGGVGKVLPDNSKRFTKYAFVLTWQSFSSGRFYFEVQVKDKTLWWLGVVRESINRKDETMCTPEMGYWSLAYNKDGLLFTELQKVGVFVDYDEGRVSFYDVEARVHIYSATDCTFTDPLYPFLYPGLHVGGKNSAPMIISPVNQTD